MCLFFIPYYMISPPYGAQSFHDEVGNWLVIGVWGSFGLAAIIPLIGIYSNKRTPDHISIICLCLFAGIGLILLGCWAYGEKDRFASLPVIRVDAKVIKTDVGRRTNYTVQNYKVYYEYKDDKGKLYKGADSVNDGATWTYLKVGGATPVNYLQADPNVSRLIEYSHGQAYLFKGFIILLGIGIIFSPIWLLRFQRQTDQKIDAWLMEKNSEKNIV